MEANLLHHMKYFFLTTLEIQEAVDWLFQFFILFSSKHCAPYDSKFSSFTFIVCKYTQDATWQNGATCLNAGVCWLAVRIFLLCMIDALRLHSRLISKPCPSLI